MSQPDPQTPKASYRLDIEGLRGVAIVLAIVFHLSPTLIDAGFIGVDVFFVISGYVITWVILDSWDAGQFSFSKFFLARIRRLIPAYLTVVSATAVFGLTCLSPMELKALAEATISASGFSSNIYFWRQLDYFESIAVERPLLHTWSLGIEAQFYLFFPFVAWLLLSRRVSPLPVTILVIAGSYVLSIWGSLVHPVPNFYLLPTRLWELLAGSVVAQIFHAKSAPLRSSAAPLAPWAGAALVLGSAFFLSTEDRWPNAWSLIPVAGTALLVMPARRTAVQSILESRGLTFLGRISYPLYLWHWPLLSYLFIVKQGATSMVEEALAIGAAIVLATLTTKYVEQPIRRSATVATRPLLIGSCTGLAVLVASSAFVWAKDGLPERLPASSRAAVAAATDINPLIYDCAAQAASGAPLPYAQCWQHTVEPSAGKWIVWGDSHAAAFAPGVASYLAEHGKSTYLASSAACPPLPGVNIRIELDGRDIFDRELPTCLAFNQRLLEWALTDPAVEGLVLTARWALWESGTGYGVIEDRAPFSVQVESGRSRGTSAIDHALVEVIRRLRGAGKQVVLLGQAPETPRYIPQCLARNALRIPVTAACGADARSARARLGPSDELLNSVAARTGAEVFLPSKVLCPDTAIECMFAGPSGIYYFDDDHLSVIGANSLGAHFTWLR